MKERICLPHQFRFYEHEVLRQHMIYICNIVNIMLPIHLPGCEKEKMKNIF